MTDQPTPGSGAPDPNAPRTPDADAAPVQPPSPLAGWSTDPVAQPAQPPQAPVAPAWSPSPDPAAQPGMPAPGMNPPAPMAPPPPKPASKLRTIIPLVVIAGIIGAVLYFTRDNQSADDLNVGLCFDVPTETTVSTVTKRECNVAHDAEVYLNVEHPDAATYPADFDAFVETNCIPAFQTYVGEAYADSEDLDIGWFFPTSDGWNDNDRTITCYIFRVDEAKMTQSVKDSAAS